MKSNITVIDKTTFVRLDFTLWSGRAKLTREDIPDADKLPPQELASLGSKRLFDPAKLRPFGALKARAHALLERNGIKFCGGYAISADRADGIRDQLADIWREFDRVKVDFCNAYANGCKEWIAQHPDWADILRNAMPSPHEMPNRFHFSYQMFQVQPTNVLGGGGNDSHTTILDMGDKALSEICVMAKTIYEETFKDKHELKAKSFQPIERLIAKIRAVSFTHPQIEALGGMLDSALTMVAQAHYSTAAVNTFKGVLIALTSTTAISTMLHTVCTDTNNPDEMSSKLFEVLWLEPEPVPVGNRAVTLDGPVTTIEVNPIAELASAEPQLTPGFDLLGMYGEMF